MSAKRTWLKWVLILLGGLLALGLLAGVGLLVLVVYLVGDTPTTCDSGYYLEVRLPPSTNRLKESCSGGINPSRTLTFMMSPADLNLFQQNYPLDQMQPWLTDPAQLSGSAWERATSRLEGQGAQLNSLRYGEHSDGAYHVRVLIDTSEADRYFVYYRSIFID